MSQQSTPAPLRAEPEPLPANITSTQPGGGACYRIELAWGVVRRCYLKTFRRGYVERMRKLRHGEPEGCPHEVLDPRDLKFFCNQSDCHWDEADDPFRWRSMIPMARWGLAELQIFGYSLVALTVALALTPWPFLVVVPLALLAFVLYFFRDPFRHVPTDPGVYVSPADGKISEITHVEEDEFVGGPAVRIGIFLSVFNVHINRSPEKARCIRLRYSPGKFLNALLPESARENEAMLLGFEEEEAPHRRFVVRQIAGAIARRIVCDVRPGEVLARGGKFGMIKFGSRTELILPTTDGLRVEVQVGQRVAAGRSVLARYEVSGALHEADS